MSAPFDQARAELTGARPTIDVAGEHFTLHGAISSLEMSELARAGELDSGTAEGAAVLAEFFRSVFGDHLPEGRRQYAAFRRHLRTVGDAGDEHLLAAMGSAVEALSGFPTQQPSASPTSPSASTPGSRDGGSPPAAQPASRATVQGLTLAVVEEDLDEHRPVELVNLGRTAS